MFIFADGTEYTSYIYGGFIFLCIVAYIWITVGLSRMAAGPVDLNPDYDSEKDENLLDFLAVGRSLSKERLSTVHVISEYENSVGNESKGIQEERKSVSALRPNGNDEVEDMRATIIAHRPAMRLPEGLSVSELKTMAKMFKIK